MPLAAQATPKKALEDAAENEVILRQHGAELVLHGHNHRAMQAVRHWTNAHGKSREIVTAGVPSASFGVPHMHEHLARYHLFRLPRARGPIEMIARGLAEPGGPVVEIERRMLGGAATRLDEET